MSVKSKDRHLAQNATLGKARELMNQILILTRPRQFGEDGSQISKPGILGEGQPLQAFGFDLITCGKRLHACCYDASKVKIRDYDTWQQRDILHRQAIKYCDSIMRQLDLCVYQYARASKRKMRSFEYCARLTYGTKQTILDRMNRDKLIYQQKYSDKF